MTSGCCGSGRLTVSCGSPEGVTSIRELPDGQPKQIQAAGSVTFTYCFNAIGSLAEVDAFRHGERADRAIVVTMDEDGEILALTVVPRDHLPLRIRVHREVWQSVRFLWPGEDVGSSGLVDLNENGTPR